MSAEFSVMLCSLYGTLPEVKKPEFIIFNSQLVSKREEQTALLSCVKEVHNSHASVKAGHQLVQRLFVGEEIH